MNALGTAKSSAKEHAHLGPTQRHVLGKGKDGRAPQDVSWWNGGFRRLGGCVFYSLHFMYILHIKEKI